MQDQINKAFAALNQRLHTSHQEFAIHKLDGVKVFISNAKAEYEDGSNQFREVNWRGCSNFNHHLANLAWFGSASMMNLLYERGRVGALEAMAKNTDRVIAKRDANIIKALEKKGVTSIPDFELIDFELIECSDGFEGEFHVDGHIVTIRTILAGGYNIQCLHQRTLIKVK
jgi:hypothetical protein